MREMAGLDEDTPLFAQVARRLAEEIAAGGLAEGERAGGTVIVGATALTGQYLKDPTSAQWVLQYPRTQEEVENFQPRISSYAAAGNERIVAVRIAMSSVA